jgi:hypothetical protein
MCLEVEKMRMCVKCAQLYVLLEPTRQLRPNVWLSTAFSTCPLSLHHRQTRAVVCVRCAPRAGRRREGATPTTRRHGQGHTA